MSRTAATVLVLLASLAASPARAACTGDCGGSAEVTLGEVQTAFGIFLSGAGLEGCAGADTSNDGDVTLGEVQTAFQNFLRGCIVLEGSCLRPAPAGSPPPGLEPCAAGTPVQALRCSDAARAECLGNPAMLGSLDATNASPGGTFAVTVDATAPEDGELVLEAEVEAGTKYRIMGFGYLRQGAGGGAGIVITPVDEVVITPVTEAAVRLIDDAGLESFSSQGIADTVEAIARANQQTSFSGVSPETGVLRAADIAAADPDVQETIRLAMGEDLEGDCRGTINADPPAGPAGSAFLITVSIAPPFDAEIVRVGTTNPGGEFDLEPQGGGVFSLTLFYQGDGPFTLEFAAFDDDGAQRCSGSIRLESLG